MTGQFYISLMTPAVAMLLSAAFFALWNKQKRMRYLLVVGSSFATCAVAFLVHDLVSGQDFDTGKFVSNVLFAATVLLISCALLLRGKVSIPYRAFAIVFASCSVLLFWFVFIEPRLDGLIHVSNITYATILAVTLVHLRKAKASALIDKLLFGMAALALVNFASRPLWIVFENRQYETYEGFQQSIYWTTAHFESVVLCLGFALIFLLAVALDLMAELKFEASIDKLSDVLNRRGFEEQGGAVLEKCFAEKSSANLVLADLDHFKQINDVFGHSVGDQVIADFGRALKNARADGAIIGRIGGEEFAILLPDTTPRDALAYANKVRTFFSRLDHPGGAETEKVTASFGVHPYTPGEDLPQMIKGADQALYLSKKGGRDRVSTLMPKLRAIA